jgi:hypothetical protein
VSNLKGTCYNTIVYGKGHSRTLFEGEDVWVEE